MDREGEQTATGVLREEHRLILKVVRELSRRLGAESDGDPLDHDLVAQCITFFRLFADACHHGKEEDLLFAELEAEGMPRDTGPIAVMLAEHARGRALVRAMADSLEPAAREDERAGDELRRTAGEYIDLMEGHIAKEDGALFDIADDLIMGPACRRLCGRYDEVCSGGFEGKTMDDLERLAVSILAGDTGFASP